MSVSSTINDLFAHHRWATETLIALARRLDDEQLDAPQPMGLGTLRATLSHLCGAEVVWLERWQGSSSPAFPDMSEASVEELASRFRQVDKQRSEFLAAEADSSWHRLIRYRNLRGESFEHRLCDLLVHVCNHGVHHRAQALQFLRRQGVRQPGGLDYIFYRLAHPTLPISPDVASACRQFGLEVGDHPIAPPEFDKEVIQLYARYGDWAMERVLQISSSLSDAQLDQPFELGCGSLRRNLIHIHDAESWWQGNWQGGAEPFPPCDEGTAIRDLQQSWNAVAARRHELLSHWHRSELQQVVSANFGAGVATFRIGESLLQLCVHGTHHRAQVLQMLRRLGQQPPALDLVVWLREH